MSRKIIPGGQDGAVIGAGSADPIGFYGQTPIPQRSNPMQHMSQGFPLGTLTSYVANVGSPANADTITTRDVALTVTGVAANDMIIAASKPTAQAGMGICGLWANASNKITVTLCNPTAANVVPTPNEGWIFAALRGFNTISANLSAGVVVTKKTKEIEFTLGGSGALGYAVTNGSGQVVSITMSNQGSGYVVPPTVDIQSEGDQQISGTFTGYGIDPAPTGANATPTGKGATGIAKVTANGTISGVQITNGGAGYPVNANNIPVTFSAGVVVSPGMYVAINKMSAANAGVGIGNVRVSGNNKIAVQYFNTTAANVTPANDLAYQIAAINNLMPVSPIAVVSANLANLTVTQANVANATSVAVPGVVATDIILNVHQASANAGGVLNGGICSANAISIEYLGGGNTTWTPANGVYNVTLLRPTMPAPARVIQLPFTTTTSIAANTSGEVVIAMPANETLFAANVVAVGVNKPSHTPGLSVVGCRAYDTGNVGITFQNLNGAAVTPPAETYTLAVFTSALPTLGANVLATASYQVLVGLSFQQLLDLSNEMQASKNIQGIIAGQ